MFDAGAIMAHLDVETKLADDKLRKFEDRVRRFEHEPHHVRVDTQFDTGSTTKARRMFAELDNMISRDAANRLRNSPQGSVLGSLNALFSPHPVSGAPTPLQASQQGLLGRMVNPPGTAAPQNRNVVAEAAATAAANEVSGGGRGGILRFLSRPSGGGGGGGGFVSGLLGGIGPSILGLGARPLTMGAGALSLLGALPALTGPLAALGVGGAGLFAARSLIGATGVTTFTQAYQQAQTALQSAVTPQQRLAAQQQMQGVIQGARAQGPATFSLFRTITSLSNTWQKFAQSMAPLLARGIQPVAGLLRGLLPSLRTFFSGAITLLRPVLAGIGDIAKTALPLLGRAFRAAAPLMKPLLDGVASLARGVLPGLIALLRAARPAVTVFAQILGMLGRDLGSMLKSLAPVMRASSVILKALAGILGGLLPIVGKLAAYFARLLAPVFLQFAAAIRALMPFLLTVGRVLGALASAVLKTLAGALVAVARLIRGIAPSLNIVAKAFSQMFSVLENTGVFASLGTALEKIAPLLAKLINTLVVQLAPELPILINLVSQFGSILITLLAAGLTTILKGFTWLLQKLPFLAPLLLALTAAWIAFDIASSANPIGLIVIAVIALIGAITLLVTHWKQVWGAIKTWAMDAWNFIYHGFGKFLLPLLGPVGLIALGAIELYQHWKTIWGGIKQVAMDFYNWIWIDFGQKIFRFLTQTLPGWFKTAVNFIGTAWTKIESAIRAPVAWVVNNVIDGLISAFDWVTSHLGLGKPITPIHPFGLSAGGRIPGYGGGDKHLALLEGGETVIDKDRSRQLAWLWKLLGIPGYAAGGAVPGGGRTGHVIGGTTGGGGFLGNLLSKLTGGGAVAAALATGNNAALMNALFGLLGHKGVGGASAQLAMLLTAVPRTLVHDAASWLISHVGGLFGGPSARGGKFGPVPTGSGGSIEALMRSMAASIGWTGSLWTDLFNVEMREAGFNMFARNPGSGAYGLAQFISGPSEYYTWGGNPNTPAGQIRAMFNYIRSRYGTPAGAWASELSRGWYDFGGWMKGWPNMTGRPEAVLTPKQSDAFLALSHAAASQGGSSVTLADVVMALDRVVAAVQATPARTGAAIGASLDSTARGARQRAGVY